MCFTHDGQFVCQCGTWTSHLPHLPSKPGDVCLRCYSKELHKQVRSTTEADGAMKNAVNRMSHAILTDGVEATVAIEAKPLAILGPGGDFLTRIDE